MWKLGKPCYNKGMSNDVSRRIDTILKKMDNDFDGLIVVDELGTLDEQLEKRNRVDITSKEFSRLAQRVGKMLVRYEQDVQTWKNAE